MLKRNIKKRLGILSVVVLLVTTMSTSVFAQTNKAVSLGADLSSAQKQQMLNEFGVTKDQAKIIEITNQDIRIQLGMDTSKPIPASSKSISSSYVEIIDKSKGIRVKTNNLTEVTSTMLMNALLTSGVKDANVIASAPYPVTGTAALAGILKGFEDATGKELSLENKEVAREEIKVTNQVGQNIGKDEAAVIMNDIKTQVIKDKPKTDVSIEKIIVNVTNNYNIDLNKQDRAAVVKLMSDVNDLDLDYKIMKDSLNQMGQNLNESLKQAGKELKESGILEKAWKKVEKFGSWLWEKARDFGKWFKGLFTEVETKGDSDKLQYDENGNLIEDPTINGDTIKNELEEEQEKTDNKENEKNKLQDNEEKDKNNNSSDSNKKTTGIKENNTADNNGQDNSQNNKE